MPTIYLIPMVLAPDTQEEVLPAYIGETIAKTKVFFVENLKTTRRYISSLKLGVVIDDLTFHEINTLGKTDDLFQLMSELQHDAAIISESGCPGVADPGADVVEMAHQLGFTVKPLVGPSSILLALMASGLNGQSFAFQGYLPIEERDREKKIKALEVIALQNKQTQLFIETPYRNKQMFATLLKVLKPDTRLGIACNITAEDEFIKTASIAWWRRQSGQPDLHKKPTIFMFM
jgi:16S rRNA (cytidine1402-2'-O)-methyltransferase